MKERKKEFQELLSDRVVVMTGAELGLFIQQYGPVAAKNESETSPLEIYQGLPRFVTGLKSLASTLNVSVSTVSRWKNKGLLDTVTFQDGKIVSFDVYGVLDILRVSNKKGKHNNLMLNRKKKETNL